MATALNSAGGLPMSDSNSTPPSPSPGEHLWSVSAHRRTAQGPLPAGAEVRATTPDARTLAVAMDAGTRLWDTGTGHWTGAPQPLAGAAEVPAVSLILRLRPLKLLGTGAGSEGGLVSTGEPGHIAARA